MYIYTIHNKQFTLYVHHTSTMRQRQQLATAMWEWDAVWYNTWYTILYTHGPLQSVDHLYVTRDIYKQYTNKRKEEKQYIYISMEKWTCDMGHCHNTRSWSDGVMEWYDWLHSCTVSMCVLHIDLTMSIPYTTLVSLPSGVCPLLTMTGEEVKYRDRSCRIT
jgi:hypothetical protein